MIAMGEGLKMLLQGDTGGDARGEDNQPDEADVESEPASEALPADVVAVFVAIQRCTVIQIQGF